MGVVADGEIARHVEVRPGDHCGDRQDAAAQRLAHDQHVGHHAIMLGGEHTAGLAEAGGDFIEDQQAPWSSQAWRTACQKPGGGT